MYRLKRKLGSANICSVVSLVVPPGTGVGPTLSQYSLPHDSNKQALSLHRLLRRFLPLRYGLFLRQGIVERWGNCDGGLRCRCWEQHWAAVGWPWIRSPSNSPEFRRQDKCPFVYFSFLGLRSGGVSELS